MKKYILYLCVFGLITVTNSSIAKSEIIKESGQTLIANADKSAYKKLIIGKWRYWGTVERGKGTLYTLTVEYFEDATYSERSFMKGVYDDTENGDFVVLSDGRVKRTYESCKNSTCKKIVKTSTVSFPNQNTMHVKYPVNAVPGTDVFKRIK